MCRAVAEKYKGGVCDGLTTIFDRLEKAEFVQSRVIDEVESSYAQGRPVGSRTRAWFDIFGSGDVSL